MDDLEMDDSIIEQLTIHIAMLIFANNLCSKITLLQNVDNSVSAFAFASLNEAMHRQGYVCCSIWLVPLCTLLPSLNRWKL